MHHPNIVAKELQTETPDRFVVKARQIVPNICLGRIQIISPNFAHENISYSKAFSDCYYSKSKQQRMAMSLSNTTICVFVFFQQCFPNPVSGTTKAGPIYDFALLSIEASKIRYVSGLAGRPPFDISQPFYRLQLKHIFCKAHRVVQPNQFKLELLQYKVSEVEISPTLFY